jgi:AraC family transcriptional regulator of adaptative response/methylated-DNA-[protein]-cysteine methyltransferase
MQALAHTIDAPRSEDVTNVTRLDVETAWAAFMRRDRAWDAPENRSVKTTNI